MRATGRTEVRTCLPTSFDEVAGGPTLTEIQIIERFIGDIEGEGTGRAIQANRRDGSATFVGIERVRGRSAELRGPSGAQR